MDEFMEIERWFGTEDPDELLRRYDQALEMLATDDVDAWLNHSMDAGVSEGALNHFRRDWVEGSEMPVEGSQITAALHDGFSAALSEARDNGVRTSIVWVERGSEFTVDHVLGGNGVTVIVSVPEGTAAAQNAPAR
jgi:hypothetical protein